MEGHCMEGLCRPSTTPVDRSPSPSPSSSPPRPCCHTGSCPGRPVLNNTAGIYLRLSDIGCQYSRSIYTMRFIMWQPRRAVDTSTNWRQSLFYCYTASMEQVTDGAETAPINGLVSSWSENISVSFCLRAAGYGWTLWCALGLLVGSTIQMPQLQLQLPHNTTMLRMTCLTAWKLSGILCFFSRISQLWKLS